MKKALNDIKSFITVAIVLTFCILSLYLGFKNNTMDTTLQTLVVSVVSYFIGFKVGENKE